MPGTLENRERWQQYPWAHQGDEWSPGGRAAGTALLWHRTLLPRILPHVPTGTILEIGPGFGRWTQYLQHLCDRLILVDVTERCIEHCRGRFAGAANIEYHVNDGSSLAMVEDGSVDFVFSFDSLVHAEADAIGAYLEQAARKLRPGGAGFIHHSNLEAFVNARTGRVRWFVTARNWRAESMSARVFRRQCTAAGLECRSQELINWVGRRQHDRQRLPSRSIPLTDCLSVFSSSDGAARTRTQIVANHRFVDEWRQTIAIMDVYSSRRNTPDAPGRPIATPSAFARKLATARTVLKRGGPLGVAALVWAKLSAAAEFAASAARVYFAAMATRLISPRSFS